MSDDIIKRLREAIAAGPTPGPWMHLVGDRLIYTKLGDGCKGEAVARVDWISGPSYLATLSFIAAASPDNIAALLDRLDAAERENERLRAERDEHARWREKLADDLHERESQIIDGWAALRDSGVQSEKNIADGIKLLRAENEALAADARRYRWLRGDACPDHSVRWTQWEVRCWVAPFWSDDLRREGLDRSIDAARAAEQPESAE